MRAMNRDAFLVRVRQAAQAGRSYRVQAVPPHVGYERDMADPPARLAAEVEAAGGRAWLVEDLPAARLRLVELLAAQRPRSVLCWRHPLLDAMDLPGALGSVGARAVSHAELAALSADEQRAAILAADLGVAAADWAVAETGSLAVAAAPGQERSATLLPPVLISVVDASSIVPDLFDLFDRLAAPGAVPDETEAMSSRASPPGLPPSSLVLITGPSKTGDIELQLTTGVHGPGQWHVIVIRQPRMPGGA